MDGPGDTSMPGERAPSDQRLLPIACTLGPGDGRDRMLRWQQLWHLAEPAGQVADGRLVLRFAPLPGVAAELAALAAAEAECCSFVSWDVGEVDGHPVLTVTAPAGSPQALDPIAAMFAPPAAPLPGADFHSAEAHAGAVRNPR